MMSMDLRRPAAIGAAGLKTQPALAMRPPGLPPDQDGVLGPMAARLHERRMQRSQQAALSVGRRRSDARILTSKDGALQFLIKPCARGLFVERTQRHQRVHL